MPTFVQLPANICTEKNSQWKTLYWTEYCDRAKQRMLKKVTTRKLKTRPIGELPLNQTFMRDHYPEYGTLRLKEDYQNMFMTTGQKCNIRDRTDGAKQKKVIVEQKSMHKDKPLLEALPETLKAIEKAWTQEVHSNKRERGNIYGKAGKKTDLSRPKTAPEKSADKMPGVDQWLETANEYEKQVVYTFLDSVSRSIEDQNEEEAVNGNEDLSASQDPKKVRVSSGPTLVQRYTPAPDSQASQRSNASSHSSRASSPAKKLTLEYNPGKASSRSKYSPEQIPRDGYLPTRRAKSEMSFREQHQPELDQKPLSARSASSNGSQESVRSQSLVRHNHSHGQIKCARCKDRQIKSLIKDLESDEASPYDPEFPGMKIPDRNRFYNTSAYYAYDPEDYVHQRSLFTNAPKGNRGYFIIHPDWVSEFKKTRPTYR